MAREIHTGQGIHVKHLSPKHWWNRARWELLQDYTSSNGMVTAPRGFITDGASIAWFLRWRFSPTGKYFGAAIVHDYVLIREKDWDRANKEFELEMEALKVSRFDRVVMVTAVKFWSWLKFDLLGMEPEDKA